MGVFSLPEDEARKAGLKEDGVRIPKGYEGAGRYMACLELTHQLQCLVSFSPTGITLFLELALTGVK